MINRFFLRWLNPSLHVDSVLHIDIGKLKSIGIRGMIFDLDNTVAPRYEDLYSPEIIAWFTTLSNMGIKACIVSNNGSGRVAQMSDPLGLPFIRRAVKPRKKPFLKAMEIMGTDTSQTAVVGDQLFTDILGGNRLGLFTILVVPLPGREYWATSLINRRLERLVLKRIKN